MSAGLLPRLLARRPGRSPPGRASGGSGAGVLLPPAGVPGPSPVSLCPLPAPHHPRQSPALPRRGAQEKALPGRGQGRRCCRFPARLRERRSRYFPPGSAAPAPSPRCLRQAPLPPAPRKTHTARHPPRCPAHSNKQTETRPVAKPTDGKVSNDFFFQVLKRQGAPGEGRKGHPSPGRGGRGARAAAAPSPSVRLSILPDGGPGTRARVRWVCLQEPGGREGTGGVKETA